MSEPKDSESFFRKVVRFVANPATDWTQIARGEDARSGELEKSELKAMVERKRRNDFVRKREFDMLRKLRREGLSAEQLAALGGSSRLDDGESRISEISVTRADSGVKAKIDEIEQQMVGDPLTGGPRMARNVNFDTPTEPAVLARQAPLAKPRAPMPPLLDDDDNDILPALPPLPAGDLPSLPPLQAPAAGMGPGLAPLAPMHMAARPDARNVATGFHVEVNEVMHDPDLDEAVIAFANADFGPCEHAITQLIRTGGARAQHAETWLVMFDLYRATGQQQPFENLAYEYAHQFGWSAPQWMSMPKLVADAAALVADERPLGRTRVQGDAGWVCPAHLDIETVARLRSQTLQMPLPWIFDWSPLRSADAEAATQFATLLRSWAPQSIEMRWQAGQCLLDVLHECAPTGVRDADPAFWLARLEVLRLANRPDQFDEVAIDYCVTYEVSPPSWEAARCRASLSGTGLNSLGPHSVISELPATFMESGLHEDAVSQVQTAQIELSGQLMGDISAVLNRLNGELGSSTVINVSCAKLIRVDFIAAGDLLNWVLSKRSEKRSVMFTEAHRLVALFFGAMGINEHARVQVRKN